ncbi:2,3-bisphosphoglycerate-dependent phosphoglycerate mutase [Rhodobiaceae bacterium]|nr:2,3-bisphosphoglycerate-dependent phosphoglycerate mutase [Rhodobiaceae bacterium]
MTHLTLVRHGQSDWNEKNLFTGWENPGLTEQGLVEAKETGKILKNSGFEYSYLYTSILDRAINTANIILRELKVGEIKTIRSSALNERDYGDLTGLNKDEARKKWGDEQVHIWRRSYDIPPPSGESLKNTAERVLPYFKKEILPLLEDKNSILISAHGNSLRALVMFIENLSSDEILKREISTGQPITYKFENNNFIEI